MKPQQMTPYCIGVAKVDEFYKCSYGYSMFQLMQGCCLSCFKKALSFLKQYFNIDFYGNFQ